MGVLRLLLRVLKTLVVLAVVLAVAGVVTLAMMLDDRPAVERRPEADRRVADRARAFVREVRALDEAETPVLTVTQEDLQAVADFGARLLPGARGLVEVTDAGVAVSGSLPVPGLTGRWLNASALVPPWTGEPVFGAVEVGGISLPPALATDALALLGDLALGGGTASEVRAALPRMDVAGDRVTMTILSDEEMRHGFTRRAFGLLRDDEMPTGPEIRVHWLDLRARMADGRLPTEGSFLPYLRWVAERGAAAPDGRAGHALTAALFALTRACGADKFHLVVGKLIDGIVTAEDDPRAGPNCDETTLRGAIDKRRHFITAATLHAASTMQVSFAIGEFKELVDSVHGPGRFDFTDITANASGIRFADTLMATDPATWPARLDRLEAEDDVLASFDGIPGELTWAEFRRRYDRVDSPAYFDQVAEIERRIDALPFHAGRPPWDGARAALIRDAAALE